MIIIHPTATRPTTLAALQIATGLRAVLGNKYALLTSAKERQSLAAKQKPTTAPIALGGAA